MRWVPEGALVRVDGKGGQVTILVTVDWRCSLLRHTDQAGDDFGKVQEPSRIGFCGRYRRTV